MIAFDMVVRILLGVVERIMEEFFDHGLEGLGEIGDDLVWLAVGVERSAEERSTASTAWRWSSGSTRSLLAAVSGIASTMTPKPFG